MNEINVVVKEYNPQINKKAISLIQEDDGNWVGEMDRFGTLVSARQSSPEVVLQMLLTHSGH